MSFCYFGKAPIVTSITYKIVAIFFFTFLWYFFLIIYTIMIQIILEFSLVVRTDKPRKKRKMDNSVEINPVSAVTRGHTWFLSHVETSTHTLLLNDRRLFPPVCQTDLVPANQRNSSLQVPPFLLVYRLPWRSCKGEQPCGKIDGTASWKILLSRVSLTQTDLTPSIPRLLKVERISTEEIRFRNK